MQRNLTTSQSTTQPADSSLAPIGNGMCFMCDSPIERDGSCVCARDGAKPSNSHHQHTSSVVPQEAMAPVGQVAHLLMAYQRVRAAKQIAEGGYMDAEAIEILCRNLHEALSSLDELTEGRKAQ